MDDIAHLFFIINSYHSQRFEHLNRLSPDLKFLLFLTSNDPQRQLHLRLHFYRIIQLHASDSKLPFSNFHFLPFHFSKFPFKCKLDLIIPPPPTNLPPTVPCTWNQMQISSKTCSRKDLALYPSLILSHTVFSLARVSAAQAFLLFLD